MDGDCWKLLGATMLGILVQLCAFLGLAKALLGSSKPFAAYGAFQS